MSQVDTAEHTNSEGHDEQLNCPNCISKYCKHNTSKEERAEFLKQFLEVLPINPQLLPLDGERKAPIIQGKCSLDSPRGKNYLVSGEEAIRRIRDDGVPGFCIWAGKPTHNTKSLVFVDYDDVTIFSPSDLPETLTTRTGSGEGYHQIFINHGDVKNAQATGKLKGAGEVRAHNQHIVTPGSIHPSGGVYHLKNNRELTTLSADHLPPELQPSGSFNDGPETADIDTLSTEFNQLRDQLEDTTIETAKQALAAFQQEHPCAFHDIHDRLTGGRGSYGSELSRSGSSSQIDRDLQEKTILTHLYGIYKNRGYSNNKAAELAYQLLSHYCLKSNNGCTEDGNPRKWAKRNKKYRQQQLQYAIQQFNPTDFQRFCNQSTKTATKRKWIKNEYSDPTRGLTMFAIDLLSGIFHDASLDAIHRYLLSEYDYSLSTEELEVLINTTTPLYIDTTGPSTSVDSGCEVVYPRKTEVTDLCVRIDSAYKGNSEETFENCLNNLRKEGRIKTAQIKNGVDYRVYRSFYPDPSGADWVKTDGNTKQIE